MNYFGVINIVGTYGKILSHSLCLPPNFPEVPDGLSITIFKISIYGSLNNKTKQGSTGSV